MTDKMAQRLPFRLADLDQYRIRESLPDPIRDFDKEMRIYRASSDKARDTLRARFSTHSYGLGEHEMLDVFMSDQPRSPIFLFIHGGAWRYLSRADSAMMAPPLHANGVTTVTIEYGLAPDFDMLEILDQCERALDWVVSHASELNGDSRRVHISGSSAGAHLAAMLLARDAGRHASARRICSASLLSGVMDLHPVMHTYMNDWLCLSEDTASALSPVLHLPAPEVPLLVAWGELEPPVMQAQSRHYALLCVNGGSHVRTIISAGRNHYNVLMDLADPTSEIFTTVLSMLRPDLVKY